MTCSVTGAAFSAVRLRYEGPEVVTYAANEDEIHGCSDSSTANLTGTYSWVHIEVVAKATGLMATYTPDGNVKDHLGNIVDTHSFTIPDIVISTAFTAPTPTPTPTALPTPTPSPSGNAGGNKIVFTRNRDFETGNGNYTEIYTMEADGTNQQRITDYRHSTSAPKWSPDKSKIVFALSAWLGPDGQRTSYGSGTYYDGSIMVMYHDGSYAYQVVPAVSEAGVGSPIRGSSPSFSPDGERIVFRRNSGIYVVNIDGSGLTQITSGWDQRPSWSPDGSTIIFERTLPDENRDLWTVSPDGSNEKRFTVTEFDEVQPVWSPDGNRIAFVYLTDAWVMDSDGSNRVNVGGNGDQSQLAWSPDGTKLAFTMPRCPTSGCTGQNNEIWTMNADGTNRTNITNHADSDQMGDW